MIYTILLLFALLAVLGVIGLTSSFVYGYYKNKKGELPNFKPEVCVIVPCKEKEQNLEKNLEAICTQNYPSYNVIFVLDSKKDTAYESVSNIVKKCKNSKVEFSEKLEGCSGKISALLAGIKKAGDIEVYVFADSDICPHKDWLKNLVAYLSDKKVGATTGFRWYFPNNWKSSLISAWNMAAIGGLFYTISNYAWGGSTAISKSLFKKLNIESKWRRGLSDDLILTEAVKSAGYQIKFVPKCVVESPSEVDIAKFLRWSSQQYTWLKWYAPFLWLLSFLGFIFLNIFAILGFILVVIGFTVPGLIMISIFLFEMIYGLVGILTLKKLMGYPEKKIQFVYRYVILMPAVFSLYAYNALTSSFKKQIVWCGRTYQKSDTVK